MKNADSRRVRLASVWGELKRRNVFRASIAYLAAAWLLLQVADIVLASFGAPDWVIQALIFSFALGFPCVVVLAWFYELTPEGIKADSEVALGGGVRLSGRKLDFAIIGLLVLAVGFLFVNDYLVDEPASASLANRRSIAVLPFHNNSANPNDAYFAAGMHDDVLTQLAKIGTLKVISRTSVMEYRDTTKNMREIGQELGVATIVEGGVQRAGDEIRMNVQLIDAETDAHLWAETFDRELTAADMFAIQREVATAIADALRATLSPQDVDRLAEVPTQSTLAYEFYLLGNDFMRREPNEEFTPRAAEMYELAVARDPEFALAWAAKSRAHMVMMVSDDRTDPQLQLAEQALERALELQPGLPEAHAAKGRYHWGLGEFEQALAEYAIAEQGLPGDAGVVRSRASAYRAMGELQQAAASMERAIELDPLEIGQLEMQAQIYLLLRNYARAEAYLDRVLEMGPNLVEAYLKKSVWIPIWRDGDIAAARTALEDAPMEIPPNQQWHVAALDRDYEAALNLLYYDYLPGREEIAMPKAVDYGMMYEGAGQHEEAARHFREARSRVEAALEANPEDPLPYFALGMALAGLGEHEDAMRAGRRFLELVPARAIGLANHRLNTATAVFLRAGGYDDALRELDAYFSGPGEWSIEGLRAHPLIDPIRDDPRFQALVEKYRRR